VEAIEGIVTRHVDLPSGGWAELRDPREIRTKDRKRALAGVSDERGKLVMGLDMMAGLAVMLVEKWSVPYSPFDGGTRLGLTFEDVDELIPGDTDALSAACEPARRLLFPGQPTPDDMSPGSPTPPVGG
jgi:hypothetical protein